MAELESNLATPLAGWVNNAWNKLPMLFGYSAIVNLNWYNQNLPAGNSGYNSDAVPSGKIWVITNVAICYGGTTSTKIDLVVYRDGIYPMIFNQASPANNIWYDRQGWWVLRAGDVLRAGAYGATAGDDLYAQAIGFAVDIAL
jgi:hypothetical protein